MPRMKQMTRTSAGRRASALVAYRDGSDSPCIEVRGENTLILANATNLTFYRDILAVARVSNPCRAPWARVGNPCCKKSLFLKLKRIIRHHDRPVLPDVQQQPRRH